MADEPKSNLPQIMPVGGEVVAVVPQSIEEIFRVSKGVVQSGLAPYALTGKTKTAEDVTRATSAVAIVIMAGAELGLPPMVSLRSFTAINGRPALYGDGLINVVRRSKMATKIDVGFTPGAKGVYDDDAAGYCTAIRKDTGEEKTVRFTVAQAKRAGLWQTEDKITKEVWDNGQKVKRPNQPNDSPWYRYPERMLGWRAAGFCLRELFGDVLGGITDDWEAREISGMVDITPQQAVTAPNRSELPDIPDEDDPAPPAASGEATQAAETGADADSGETDAPASEAPDEGAAYSEEFLSDLETLLGQATTPEEIETAFDKADPHKELAGDEDALARAFTIKKDAIAKLRADLEAQGQGSMFPGDKPFPGEK